MFFGISSAELIGQRRGGHVTQICDRLLGCYRFRCHNRTDAYRRVRWTRRPNVRDLELAALRRTGVRLCVAKFLWS